MSETSGSRHDPLAALRQRGFLWFSLSRFASAVAQTGLGAVLLWEVHRLNASPLALAMLGVVRFVPQLIAARALQGMGGGGLIAMAHATIAYAKAHARRRMMAVTTSIGPGATNMVTAAAGSAAIAGPSSDQP